MIARTSGPSPTTPPPATRDRRGPIPTEETGTRQRVIEAAISCILERGFYRASTNAIAETAGLSWGVIQYYFGSREALMLAVMEEGNRRLTSELEKANLATGTLTQRLRDYLAVLEGYYAQPEYLAFIQVLLNLSHDPRTSERTRTSMDAAIADINKQLDRLANQLFSGTRAKQALRSFTFHSLRGVALSEVMLQTLPFNADELKRRINDHHRYLISAVALLLESEGVHIP